MCSGSTTTSATSAASAADSSAARSAPTPKRPPPTWACARPLPPWRPPHPRLQLRRRRGPPAAPLPPRHLVGGRHPGRLQLGSTALRHRVLPGRGCRQPGRHPDHDVIPRRRDHGRRRAAEPEHRVQRARRRPARDGDLPAAQPRLVGAPAGAAPTRRQGIQHTRLTTASNRMRLLHLEDGDALLGSAGGYSGPARARSHPTQPDILYRS